MCAVVKLCDDRYGRENKISGFRVVDRKNGETMKKE